MPPDSILHNPIKNSELPEHDISGSFFIPGKALKIA
jgi:hypothetical protein